MENINTAIRTALFGGFNKEDVIRYIENLKNEFYDYQKKAEAKISELEQKISILENSTADEIRNLELMDELSEEIFTREDIPQTPSTPASEINAAASQLKETADNICDCLNEFMDKIAENSISVTVEMPVEVETDEAAKDDEKTGISSLLSSLLTFDEGKKNDNSDNSNESIFSQIVSSVVENQDNNADNQCDTVALEESEGEDSILDKLLPNSLFTVK
ncbi:MAG: hypothetical protein NC122_02450 [Faecalibacterium sp.]|nr:hypothetical protein [Ruminococcus sp.]MCM1391764.1 hypothetical protein [Ruminococcus sp.]MCM1485044.1 hypothetical protein [Faecalibacterium sp.]